MWGRGCPQTFVHRPPAHNDDGDDDGDDDNDDDDYDDNDDDNDDDDDVDQLSDTESRPGPIRKGPGPPGPKNPRKFAGPRPGPWPLLGPRRQGPIAPGIQKQGLRTKEVFK